MDGGAVMAEQERPRTEAQDGPTTRKPHGTPFTSWTVLPLDDVDGVTWYFHVPTPLVEAARTEGRREATTTPAFVKEMRRAYKDGLAEGRQQAVREIRADFTHARIDRDADVFAILDRVAGLNASESTDD